MQKSSPISNKIIVDSNIIFSAILFPKGNERKIFDESERSNYSIIILDYVEEEMRRVFDRKKIDIKKIVDFFDTYRTILFVEIGEISIEIVHETIKQISDNKDRPIFAFLLKKLKEKENIILISGDHGFYSRVIDPEVSPYILRSNDFLKQLNNLNFR